MKDISVADDQSILYNGDNILPTFSAYGCGLEFEFYLNHHLFGDNVK